MKYPVLFTAVIFLLLCSCATAPKSRFSVNPRSPSYPAGSAGAQSDKVLSNEVQKRDITVSYFPVEDAVCLEYRVDFVSYYLYWDRLGREVYKTALERYKIDYEQRNLNTKSGRKERRAYGTVRGFLGWQVSGFLSDMATGPSQIDIGYSFKGQPKNRTPYFTVTQNEAEFQNSEVSSRKITSVKVMLYFTRAQAEELAALFDQEYLLGLTAPKSGSSGAEADEY
jgi:hypothetical protein